MPGDEELKPLKGVEPEKGKVVELDPPVRMESEAAEVAKDNMPVDIIAPATEQMPRIPVEMRPLPQEQIEPEKTESAESEGAYARRKAKEKIIMTASEELGQQMGEEERVRRLIKQAQEEEALVAAKLLAEKLDKEEEAKRAAELLKDAFEMTEEERAAMLLAQEIEKTEVLLSSEQVGDNQRGEELEVASNIIPVIANEEPKLGDEFILVKGIEDQVGSSRPIPVEKDKVPNDGSKQMPAEISVPVKPSLPEYKPTLAEKIEVPDEGKKPIPVKENKKKKKDKVHTSVLLEVVLRLEGNLEKVVTEQKVTKKAVLCRTKQLFDDQRVTRAELGEFRAEIQGKIAGVESGIDGLKGELGEIKEMFKAIISSKTPASEAPKPPMLTGIPKRKFEGKVPDIFWEYCAAPWEVQKHMAPKVFGFNALHSTLSSSKPVILKKKPTAAIDLDESPPAKKQKKDEK